jgi:hypothetical protein
VVITKSYSYMLFMLLSLYIWPGEFHLLPVANICFFLSQSRMVVI